MLSLARLWFRAPVVSVLIAGLWAVGSCPLRAQESGQMAAQIKALEARLRVLEAEVRALKGTPAAPPVAATPAPPPPPAPLAVPQAAPPPGAGAALAGPLPVYGGSAAMSKVLNPDISVIGDFLGSAGRNSVRPVPVLEMHESEVGLQAIIDPYARGDFFLTFGEQGVGLEEGYITFTSLPAGLVAKAGKFRSVFGKVNTLHNHVLPWTDRPMVTDNLVGGEDGINDAGASLTRAFAGPRNLFLEATGQVFRGDSDGLFMASRKSDLAVVGHLRAYKDLNESTNLDIGGSYARGHNAPPLPGNSLPVLGNSLPGGVVFRVPTVAERCGDFAGGTPCAAPIFDYGSAFLTNLYGIDATLRWKPLRRAIYHSFTARSEFVWSNREQMIGAQHAFGFYTSGEYRLNRRWTVGGRYDRTGRADNAALTDSGASALLTYWPSEFSQIRWQYRFARYAEKTDANELRLQFLFSLGAHGAHPF